MCLQAAELILLFVYIWHTVLYWIASQEAPCERLAFPLSLVACSSLYRGGPHEIAPLPHYLPIIWFFRSCLRDHFQERQRHSRLASILALTVFLRPLLQRFPSHRCKNCTADVSTAAGFPTILWSPLCPDVGFFSNGLHLLLPSFFIFS